MNCKIGIIGGSGLESPEILKNAAEVALETPYGAHSPIREGMIDGVAAALLSRHGYEHTIPPSSVNNRANIWALKSRGCTHILASTAVGSLREEIRRGDLVVLDQFIDFTRFRPNTFFESFEPHDSKHTAMADPFDAKLRRALIGKLRALGYPHHETGTVITIEGPRFSTRAESRMFRAWGADVINMSVSIEVMLANEAKIPYAAIGMSTDYDAWKMDEEPVSWDMILKVSMENSHRVLNLFTGLIPQLPTLV